MLYFWWKDSGYCFYAYNFCPHVYKQIKILETSGFPNIELCRNKFHWFANFQRRTSRAVSQNDQKILPKYIMVDTWGGHIKQTAVIHQFLCSHIKRCWMHGGLSEASPLYFTVTYHTSWKRRLEIIWYGLAKKKYKKNNFCLRISIYFHLKGGIS